MSYIGVPLLPLSAMSCVLFASTRFASQRCTLCHCTRVFGNLWPRSARPPASSQTMLSGSVRFGKEDGGVGSIVPDEPRGDVCVHRHALQNASRLKKKEQVQYYLAWNYRKRNVPSNGSCCHNATTVTISKRLSWSPRRPKGARWW